MATRTSLPAQENAARQLMRAILQARPELEPKLQEALTSEVAWALAVLIASWRTSEPPSDVEITRWQAELARLDLSPEMRWLYEQKLLGSQRPGYRSPQAARDAWTAALGQARNPGLRGYFAENLKTLERT